MDYDNFLRVANEIRLVDKKTKIGPYHLGKAIIILYNNQEGKQYYKTCSEICEQYIMTKIKPYNFKETEDFLKKNYQVNLPNYYTLTNDGIAFFCGIYKK